MGEKTLLQTHLIVYPIRCRDYILRNVKIFAENEGEMDKILPRDRQVCSGNIDRNCAPGFCLLYVTIPCRALQLRQQNQRSDLGKP